VVAVSSPGIPPLLDPKLESQSVATKGKFLGGCALLCALAGGLSIPPFSLCMAAQTPATRPGMPADLTIVPYVYKGQSFEIRLLRGQLFMVAQNGLPVVMYMRGTVRPISTDPAVVSLAEEAAKAYQAGAPSGVAGGAGAAGTAGPPSAGTASSAGLTVDGVISLLGAGISDDLIIAKIQKSGQAFDLSTDDMVRLKKAGASDAVMKAMMSATPARATVSAVPVAGPNANVAPSADVAPNPVAENPNMGKLKKEGFMATIEHGVSNGVNGKSVIDRLSMRNILPQWDPNQKLSQQYPHIAITVLYAPMGWTEDYRVVLRKYSKLLPPCFKLKAVVWLDATRSKPTDEFEWCIDKDMFMSELQPTYLYSLAASGADHGQTTGANRTDGPQPPDKLLPNDRATLDMEAKTNPHGASKDLNLDENSLFAIMFANVRKDLGQTLGSDGDFRVWITTIKKAAGPSLF
jgi:hypothetical protein